MGQVVTRRGPSQGRPEVRRDGWIEAFEFRQLRPMDKREAEEGALRAQAERQLGKKSAGADLREAVDQRGDNAEGGKEDGAVGDASGEASDDLARVPGSPSPTPASPHASPFGRPSSRKLFRFPEVLGPAPGDQWPPAAEVQDKSSDTEDQGDATGGAGGDGEDPYRRLAALLLEPGNRSCAD